MIACTIWAACSVQAVLCKSKSIKTGKAPLNMRLMSAQSIMYLLIHGKKHNTQLFRLFNVLTDKSVCSILKTLQFFSNKFSMRYMLSNSSI